jgi:hypothetical protein
LPLISLRRIKRLKIAGIKGVSKQCCHLRAIGPDAR